MVPLLIVATATLGAIVGAVELLNRYRDQPLRSLWLWPSWLYCGVNAAASGGALALLRLLNWRFGLPNGTSELGVGSVQALVAGLGALTIFRIRLLPVGQTSETRVGVGPGNLLESILDICDREIDRSRSSERQQIVAQVLAGLSFERDHIGLTQLTMASLVRLRPEDADRLGVLSRRLTETDRMTDEERMICYALDLLQVGGLKAVSAAASTIREEHRPTNTPADQLRATPGSAMVEVRAGGWLGVLPSFPPALVGLDELALRRDLDRLIEGERDGELDLTATMDRGRLHFLLSELTLARNEFVKVIGSTYRAVASQMHPAASEHWNAVHWDAWLWTLACDSGSRVDLDQIVNMIRGQTATVNSLRWHAESLLWLANRMHLATWRIDVVSDSSADLLYLVGIGLEVPSICRAVVVAALLDRATRTYDPVERLELVERSLSIGGERLPGARTLRAVLRNPDVFLSIDPEVAYDVLEESGLSAEDCAGLLSELSDGVGKSKDEFGQLPVPNVVKESDGAQGTAVERLTEAIAYRAWRDLAVTPWRVVPGVVARGPLFKI